MSATASLNISGDSQHFHRNGDQFPHFQNKKDEKKHSHPHTDKPVHKRPRRTPNPNHPQPHQMIQQFSTQAPPVYRQDIPYGFNPSPNPSNFPPEMNFSQFSGNFPITPSQLPFGQLNTPQQMNSLPNLPIASNQPITLLNENMLASFPPPSTLPQLQLPVMSPLGFDIGSMSNLPTLLVTNAQAEQQFNARQVMLEQLKAQELAQQQQLLKLQPAKKIPSQEFVGEPAPDRRPSHNDILKQHNEEYRLKQMKKAAVQQASSRYGYYSAEPESSHFNFIVPSLPTKFVLEAQEDSNKS